MKQKMEEIIRNINLIPLGKENRLDRKTLMQKMNIFDVKIFKKEISKLKEDNIILFEENGYYRPSTEEDYNNFIEKEKEIIKSVEKTIKIAEDERGKLNEYV